MIQTINATIKSIARTASKSGDPAIRIICNHPDGSDWGKQVSDWIGLDKAPDFVFTRWAELIESCNTERAKEILTGAHWGLIGLEVTLEVDTEDEKWWRIKSVRLAKEETESTAASVIDDEIPF